MQRKHEGIKYRSWHLAWLLIALFTMPLLLTDQLIKSGWFLMLLFGALTTGINSSIIYVWFGPFTLFWLHLICYGFLFALLLLLYSQTFYLLFNGHAIVTALNHLIHFLRSPLPAMIYIPFCMLYQRKQQSLR